MAGSLFSRLVWICLAHTLVQGSTANLLEDFVKSFADRLWDTQHAKFDDRWNFEESVCSSTPGPVHTNDGGVDLTNCSLTDSWDVLLCVGQKMLMEYRQNCRRLFQDEVISSELGVCTTMITIMGYLANLANQVTSFFGSSDRVAAGNRYCWPEEGGFRDSVLRQKSRSLIDGCHLRNLQSGACPYGPLQRHPDLHETWYVQTAGRIVLAYVTSELRQTGKPLSSLGEICWEPDLVAAERVYLRPGQWRVGDQCVDYIERIAIAVVESLSRSLNQTVARLSKVSANKPFPHTKSILILLSGMPSILDQLLDPFLQVWVYPSMQSFRATAKTRTLQQGNVSSQPAVVSCDGLRGNPREIYSNTMQLLRLVLVNGLHVQRFRTLTLLSSVVANELIRCTLPTVLSIPSPS